MRNMSKKPVITIGREYGAGGRTVAKALSKAFDIPWYDRDFVKMTSEDSGYTVDEINRDGEEISSRTKLIDAIFSNASYTSAHDAIFNAQRKEIVKLAANAPCIIVGRCSNVVLREANIPSFDIFLYGSLEFRMKRAAELGENKDMDLQKYVEQRDVYRSNYYKTYTKKSMGDYHDYDICVDMSSVGTEKGIEMIISALKDILK